MLNIDTEIENLQSLQEAYNKHKESEPDMVQSIVDKLYSNIQRIALNVVLEQMTRGD